MTITAFDLPGHGQMPAWDGCRDLHDESTDIGRSFLSGTVDLIGHSFGATVALRLAVEHPERVRTLTLIEPVLFAVAEKEDRRLFEETRQADAPYLEALNAGEREQAARLFNRRWGDGTKWKDFPEKTRRYMAERIHMVPEQTPAIFRDVPGVLNPGQLDRVDMPCLLLRGADSPQIIEVIQTGLARRMPQARLHVVNGAGHMLPITHPRQTAAAIRSLVEMAQE